VSSPACEREMLLPQTMLGHTDVEARQKFTYRVPMMRPVMSKGQKLITIRICKPSNAP
jgi:hypothetical protein